MARKKKAEVIEESFDYKSLIAFVVIGLLIYFSIFEYGVVGTFINNLFTFLCGPYYIWVLITLFICFFINVFLKKRYSFNYWFYIGLIILNAAILLLGAYLIEKGQETITTQLFTDIFSNIKNMAKNDVDYGGGLIGVSLLYITAKAFELKGTFIIIIVLFTLSLILIVPLGVYKTFFSGVKDTGAKLKEKHSAFMSERKADKERKLEERRIQIEEENQKRTQLENDMKAYFSGQISADTISIPTNEQNIEKVPNTSAFSMEYFLKDDLSQDKKQEDNTIKDIPVKKTETIEEPLKHEQLKLAEETSCKDPVVSVKNTKIYRLPPSNILSNDSGKPSNQNKASADVKGKELIKILHNFGIEASLVNTFIGPSVTKFEIKPSEDVKVNRINGIADNIKMGLKAKTIRIEAPIPGKDVVGVEIPNVETVMVRMSELMRNVPSKYNNSKLMFALGKNLLGEPVYCELNKMPHLLVAGATGSGKSVCMNTIITSFLLRANPNDVKIVLVDPKKVEFTPYHDIPHLLWPVITDSNMASMMLKKMVVIMEERYETFAECAVRNIADYNEYVLSHNKELKQDEQPLEKMPYIAIIIDELADLMMVAKKDVEASIQRLTQLSRACGMHLIVATQRPSTDVITGLIKSNIPSRISFAVSSSIDSRTILDQTGAEKLLGYGDMLYFPSGESAPIRVQGCFVKDEEIKKITDYCKKQAIPDYDDTYFELKRLKEGDDSFEFKADGKKDRDSLYDEAVEFVRESQKASTSLLQRRFGIGYNRAARIIDQLEDNNIIGPANGSKPREVFVKRDDGDAGNN